MDHIQQLLAQTGWSCEDLMKKLSEFKQKNNSDLSSNCNEQQNIVTASTSNGYELKNNGHAEDLRENNLEAKKIDSLLICDNDKNSEVNNVKNDEKCDDNPIEMETSVPVTDENIFNKSSDIKNSISIVDRLKNKLDNNIESTDLELSPIVNNSLSNNVIRKKRKLSDHTYIRTNTKRQRKDQDSSSPRNLRLHEITRSRKNFFLLRNRHRRRLQAKLSRTDRKLLIAQYKCPEVVRSEILKQLELLRTRKPHFEVQPTVTINDSFVNKKRYLPTKLNNGYFESKPSCSSYNHFDIPEIFDEENGVEFDSAIEMMEEDTSSIKNIKIADVRGGCDVLQESRFDLKNLNSQEDKSHMIKPTKTRDITKIKGWRSKKFDIADKIVIKESKLDPVDEVTNDNADSNSAFASSDLDGFLATACADISFNVEPPPPPLFILHTKQEDIQDDSQELEDSLNLHRARTKRIMKIKYDSKGKREGQKPRTLAEKRRLLGVFNKKTPTYKNKSYSYIIYRGKRLRVHTKTNNDVIAHVKHNYGKRDYIYVPRKPRNSKTKPSIFKNTFSPIMPTVRYRPGPLCKKANLQCQDDNWRTVIKKLPKITLGIIPRYQKPLDPKIIHLLPKYDFDLTTDRVEFALTALKPQDTTISVFEIKVPYQNNQEDIVLQVKTEETPPEIVEEASIEDTCKEIVGKMLDYLEIKEISDEVVKSDVNNQLLSEDKFECNQMSTTAKKPKKQSKTNYELKRLNVKVIEVNLEEKEDVKDCKNDYCALGCVCNSLATTSSLLANHCGRPECMFECECDYQKKSKGNVKVTLPIGTDLLSEGAVNRLEVEAKRNLAKVEKEFTQTVIQANNQTIVVGGCTNRQRRVTKLPKKYNDFIKAPEIITIIEDKFVTSPTPDKVLIKEEDKWNAMECSVSLQKLEVDQIIPFCLVHNLYDCHCEYKAEYVVPVVQEEKSPEDEVETIIITSQPEKLPKVVLKGNRDISRRTDKVKLPYFTNRFEINYCARTRGIPTQYYVERNRSERFIITRDRKFVRDMSKACLEIADPEVEPNSREAVLLSKRNKRRKQELIVKEDLPDIPLKKPKRPKMKLPRLCPTDKGAILKFRQLFPTARKDHHYFSPSPDITQKFLSLLSRKEGTIFYLLQWQTLVNGYEENKIQLWYSTYFKVPKIVITNGLMLPKYFSNIKQYEKVSNKNQIKNDIIRALVTGTVPGGNCKDDMQVILELSPQYCQIHGTIKKNQDKQENLILPAASDIQKSPKIIKVESLNDVKLQIPQPSLPIVRKIMFKKHLFLKQNLSTIAKDGEFTEPNIINAHLPAIKDGSLWRMIKLNSDFNVLSLTRNCYSIKYSDIQKVLKMAVEKSMTIVLKTEVVSKNYPHKDFGIYVSPNVDQAFFIGPYYELEQHDISTFRYLNRELIRTEMFNKMKGLPPVVNGVWLRQCSEECSDGKALTIDLTESDQEEAPMEETPIIQESTESLLFNLNDFDYYEFTAENYTSNLALIDDDVSTDVPTMLGNIYFLTNVDTLGFVLGHKLEGDAVLLRWPMFHSVLKFRTYSNAVEFLQRELEATFIQAPGFNFTITISTENTGTIFNPNYLKGYYIVNEKGLTNVMDVTKTTLAELKLSKPQLEDLVKKRASKLVYDNCYEVAKLVFTKQELLLGGTTSSLTKMMHKEILRLERENVEYLNALKSMTKRKDDILDRFAARCEQLWPHKNNKFKNKLIEVLKSHGRTVTAPEEMTTKDGIICIEIDDDDDEEPPKAIVEPISGVTLEKLPIYTKNPSMIITANVNEKPAVEIIPKISVKSTMELTKPSPIQKEISVLKEPCSESKHLPKPRKYLLKTSTGAVIEIPADQYKKLRAQNVPPRAIAIRRKLVSIAPKLTGDVSEQAVLSKGKTSQLRHITLKPTAVPGSGFMNVVNTVVTGVDVVNTSGASTNSDVVDVEG